MNTATRAHFCRNCLAQLPPGREYQPETMLCGTCLEQKPLSKSPAAAGLTCPACGATTPGAVKGRFFFKCEACDRAVERLDGSEGSARSGLKTRRVSLEQTRDTARIAYRWPAISAVALMVLVAVGGAFASLVPFDVMFADAGAIAKTVLGASVLGLLSYGALAYLLSRTVIDCREGTVTVRVEPIPWQKAMSVRASQIRRVFTTLEWTRMGTRGPRVKRYDVTIELESGERRILLHGLDCREDAFAASHALRSWVESLRPENW